MPKVIFGSLLKNRIKHSMDENKYSKIQMLTTCCSPRRCLIRLGHRCLKIEHDMGYSHSKCTVQCTV